MQNGTYPPWMASSSITQKSWNPGYQASLTDLFLKKNHLHFGTGISTLAAASNYIEKMSSNIIEQQQQQNPPQLKCPHLKSSDKPYPCEICEQYLNLCNPLRGVENPQNNNNNGGRQTASPPSVMLPGSPLSERKPMNLMPNGPPPPNMPNMNMHPGGNLPPGMQNLKPRPIPTKQYPCPVCHKLFTQKGNLKTHMMIHTGEKPYACHACGKSFTQKGNVDTHMKIHTGEREYGCEACGKRFTQKGNLKTHIRSVHTKEKPFACGLCGKCFSQKGNMQTHLRTHNKDDRFPCTLCGKTFSQKGNLKTHMARHAGQIPTKRQFGSRLANRTYIAGQLISKPPSSLPQMRPFPIQPSPVSSQASTTSPLHSPTTPGPNHPDIRSPLPGMGGHYSESPIDLKPPLNCHLPLSRPMSCNQPPSSPGGGHLSSPSPEDDDPRPPSFIQSKLFLHNQAYLTEQMHAELQQQQQQHHNGSLMNSRITSPPNSMQNHERDSRPFYSAPPTPIPAPLTPVSRWLPHGGSSRYDGFQSPAGLGGYSPLTPHTTPLSRLSLLAAGSMNNNNQHHESPNSMNHNQHQEPPSIMNHNQHHEPPSSINHNQHHEPPSSINHNQHHEPPTSMNHTQHHEPPNSINHREPPSSMNHTQHHEPPDGMNHNQHHKPASNISHNQHHEPPSSMNHNQQPPPMENSEDMDHGKEQPENIQSDPQRHFHSPTNPDFSQLLD